MDQRDHEHDPPGQQQQQRRQQQPSPQSSTRQDETRASGRKTPDHDSRHHMDMGLRGVGRPMAEPEFAQQRQQQQQQRQQPLHREHERMPQRERQETSLLPLLFARDEDEQRYPQMSRDERRSMIGKHHRQTLWMYWTVIFAGVWMMMFPFTFSHAAGVVEPSGGREVWLSLEARIAAMAWSDVLSGAGLVLFGWRSLLPNRPYSMWICCFIGIWLIFAPLILWSPTAVGYLNSTIIGTLVIALTTIIPGMPNMIKIMKVGPDMPRGWSYNPSSWPQRAILIALAFLGWMISRHLAAYQLGYVDRVWEPFFGEGSRRVLDSNLSHAWPISDAGLGATAYTFEFLMGFMGSTARWRTMPWMVLAFGVLIIPLGLAHIVLVISQPVIVGQWCTLCLLAAAVMLPMIPLMADEVAAMIQYRVHTHQRGEPFWPVFWKGGSVTSERFDDRSPELINVPRYLGRVWDAALWGMSFPFTLVIAVALGIWLMFTPAIMGMADVAASLVHVCGALVITVSVIAMAEILRLVRLLNVLIALIVIAGPWFASGNTVAGGITCVIVGLLVIVLSLPRGPKTESYGMWDIYVR